MVVVVVAAAALCIADAEGDRSRRLGPQANLSVLPHTFLQVGLMRTSSTLQFITVCAAVAIKVMHDPKATVNCYFLKKPYELVLPQPNEYLVIKSHGGFTESQFEALKKFTQQPHDQGDWAWVFYTSHNTHIGSLLMLSEFQELDIPVAMQVDTVDVANQSFLVRRKDYEKTFGLSVWESQLLYDYLELWDVLRICCGEQMATRWRKHLVDGDKKHGGGGRRSGTEW